MNELASHYSRPTTPAGHSRTDGHGHRTSGPSSPHDKIKASRYTASYGAQPARRPGTAGPGPARPGTAGPRPQHAEQPDRQPTPEQTRRPPRPDSAPPQQPPPAAAPPPKPSAPEESTGRFVPVPVYAVAGRPTSLEELIQQKVRRRDGPPTRRWLVPKQIPFSWPSTPFAPIGLTKCVNDPTIIAGGPQAARRWHAPPGEKLQAPEQTQNRKKPPRKHALPHAASPCLTA